jgi:hypothetical protein
MILPEEKIQIEKCLKENKQHVDQQTVWSVWCEEVVQNNPDQIALSGEGGQWTYRELSVNDQSLAT